ncbi:membrane protein insertase YidC [Buchnera aphidicola (Chaitoregma tattakana)]|uniref:membrane protein insertase YidC n=1 Tax=Buchnera aphidicola TaxID=9 RepID=UPI0031B83269
MYWIKNTFILILLFILAFFVYKFNNKNFFHSSVHRNQVHNTVYKYENDIVHTKNFIFVKTDNFKILIDKLNGNIISTHLLKYKETIGSSNTLHLLKSKKDFIYVANSGLLGLEKNKFYYDNEYNKKNFFKLLDNEDKLCVPMKWTSKNGLSYIKTFIFQRGKYFFKVKYDIFNNTGKKINVSMFGNLKQSIKKEKDVNYSNLGMRTFRGVAYSNAEHKYKKVNFDSIDQKRYISNLSDNKWIAMVQPYFVSAWIPDRSIKSKLFSDKVSSRDISVGYVTENLSINKNENKTLCSTLWIGPKIKKKMLEISDSLYFTIDYGFLWFLSQPLFELLNYLNKFFQNWGISIIAITCIIKLIMYPISKIQYVQMAKVKSIQKEISLIKRQYKDNKSMLSNKIVDLYKKNNINPIGSFLPIIVQMPMFLSLYYVIIESVELRHAPFILWIQDLSDKDPFFILPILMGITTFLLQNDSEDDYNLDKIHKIVIQTMPVFFTIFFLWFPSGLVLYYIISNILTIIQQKIIFNKFNV